MWLCSGTVRGLTFEEKNGKGLPSGSSELQFKIFIYCESHPCLSLSER